MGLQKLYQRLMAINYIPKVTFDYISKTQQND